MKFRTAQINALHGTLLEFGETIHKGRAEMDRELPAALERLMEIPGVGPLIATAAVVIWFRSRQVREEKSVCRE